MNRTLSVIGGLFTLAYLVLLSFLLGDRIEALVCMPLNEVGDFLAGVFGPLAFIWLVLGFFQQGIELRQNSKALQLQADELRNSVEQQRQLVQVTREQVSVELEAMAHERERIRKAALPRLVFQAAYARPGSPSGFQRYRVNFTNVGMTCTAVRFVFDSAVIQQPQPMPRPSWESGDEVSIFFDCDVASRRVGQVGTLTISFKDGSLVDGFQMFAIYFVEVHPQSQNSLSLRMEPL